MAKSPDRETQPSTLQWILVLAGLGCLAAGLILATQLLWKILFPCIFATVICRILYAIVPIGKRPIVLGCAIFMGYGLWNLLVIGFDFASGVWPTENRDLLDLIDPLVLAVLPIWLLWRRAYKAAQFFAAYQLMEIVLVGFDMANEQYDAPTDEFMVPLFLRVAGMTALGIGFLEIHSESVESRNAEKDANSTETDGEVEKKAR